MTTYHNSLCHLPQTTFKRFEIEPSFWTRLVKLESRTILFQQIRGEKINFEKKLSNVYILEDREHIFQNLSLECLSKKV